MGSFCRARGPSACKFSGTPTGWIPDTSPKTLLAQLLHFSGLKPEPNMTLAKLLRPINLELPAPIPLLQKDTVSPVNESASLTNDLKITGAITAGN
ncbi:hypothetical protein DSO57_1018816 [Entomophthora muscae]|uniref:Uncharacterized protein n=1 Tax=Entomophthora muscae TaxID=34485 RepID=A0ACC2ST76_9FUNG|nr:hypothetical protein DSO57_1018816 [Entomophthora muscae]